jgi:heme/copper-type cytochrome/quinol oxidase subunit 3
MSATAAADAAHDDHESLVGPPDEYGSATSGKIAMWIFLLSDAFSFSGFLLAYGILRGGAETWIQPGQPALGINFTAAMTFLLICSSVTMVLAHASCVEGDRKGTLFFLGLTILGGALFLGGQAYEYIHLSNVGLHFGDSHYSSTFYCITSFHGLHVLTGVLYLTVMFIRTARGKYDNGNHNHIEIAGLFWHFVDLVWILVFTFVYLI